MTFIGLLLTIVAAALGFAAIEKKRAQGALTYPLWRGNLLIPWGGLALVFTVLMGSMELPPFIALAERGVAVQADVILEDKDCQVTYSYAVQGKEYKGLSSKCGLNTMVPHWVYYDPASPDVSTLYPPAIALKDELAAMALIALCLPTLIVIWLMATHVIGRREKS